MPGGPRLVYVVTHPVSADTLLRGQLAFMRSRGFAVTIVSSPGPELDRVREREGVDAVAVPMARPIRLRRDAAALASLARVLARLRPDIVNASTPKAGLLGMLAAGAVGVPVRVYLLRGLRLETARGHLRRVLGATERVASACAQHVVCVSESLREAAVRGGFVPAAKARLVGEGSSNGVDVARFTRTAERLAEGRRRLRALGVPDDTPVVGFVGRLDRDKGIADLLDAAATFDRARIVLVGVDLADDADPALLARVRTSNAIVVPKTSDLAPLYARMSVLAFPSYREGFPNVPLEAACAGVPVVGYRATGTVDAVVDGTTGLLVDVGDVTGLGRGIARYLGDESLARRHGAAGRARAESFANERVWAAWADFYGGLAGRI